MSKDLLDLPSLDLFFNSIFHTDDWATNWSKKPVSSTYQLPVDIIVKENRDAVVDVAIAGYKEENISIDFDGDNLVVSVGKEKKEEESKDKYICRGIKRSNAMVKVYIPASRYDYNKATATINDGILSIYVPARDETKPKRIEIIKK